MNRLKIDKKMIRIVLPIFLLIMAFLFWSGETIDDGFNFTKAEVDLIRQTDQVEIRVSSHFLFDLSTFGELSDSLWEDLELKVTFKVDDTAQKPLMSYPMAIYDKGLEPYQGDYLYDRQTPLRKLTYDQESNLNFEVFPETFSTIVPKIFRYYDQKGQIARLVHLKNMAQFRYYVTTNPFFEPYWDFDKAPYILNIGIENMPPVAYIQDKNVYGLMGLIIHEWKSLNDEILETELLNLQVNAITGLKDGLLEAFNSSDEEGRLDAILTHDGLVFHEDALVIVSTQDFNLYEDFPLKNKNLVSLQAMDGLNTRIESHQRILELILEDTDFYFVIPRSFYDFIQDKLDYPHLHVNGLLEDTVPYGLKVHEEHYELLQMLLKPLNTQRFLDYSIRNIEDEKTVHRSQRSLTIGMIVLGLILATIVIVRLILSINEKQRLNYLFKYDQLTYLPNNYGLKKLFKNMTAKEGYMLLVDLRHFKLINDTYNMEIGDQILIELANAFKNIGIPVGRTSGDQFTFLTNDFDHLQVIMDIFSDYRNQSQYAKNLNISACYVKFPEYGQDYNQLKKYLESAMHHAKDNNITGQWVRFDEGLYKHYITEQELVIEIEKAIEHEDFELYYQPQTDLASEKTIGAEVLVRWTHKDRGKIFPDQFLGVAERNGLMRRLDMYMIRKACQQIKAWQDRQEDYLKISVNMSTFTFESQGMSQELLDIVSQSRIDTTWFALEITEESGFMDLKHANEMMTAIKAHGIRFALDDFGKGYSSINYLEKLPFDFLKIDKAFVDHIHTSEKSRKLYKLINDLAKLYNMHIIAEGVEYKEQVDVIKENMATIIQGYYYSRPLTVEDFEQRIKDQKD